MNSDYRDLVITDLADELAALTVIAASAEIAGGLYRELALAAIAELARAQCRAAVYKRRLYELLDERRNAA